MVGPNVAKYLCFTGQAFPATDLLPLELVNEVVPDESFMERVKGLARCLAAKNSLSLAHTKRLIDDGLEQPLATALRLEQQALAIHAHSHDMHEGLTAFREGRKPRFT